MSLPFEPACAPMLLGSMPGRNAAEVLTLARKYTSEILAWPQLWQRSYREQFLPQSAAGFPGLVIDEAHQHIYVDTDTAVAQLDRFDLAFLQNQRDVAKLNEREAAGLFELGRQTAALRAVKAIKGQLLGPISMALYLTDEHDRPLIYNTVLLETLVQFLRMRMAWMQHYLGELGQPLILCLDEPYLEMVGSPFMPLDWEEARAYVRGVLADVAGCQAISVNGMIDWRHMLAFDTDMVVGNVFDFATGLLAAAEPVATFVEQGGLIGLGIVPTEREALVRANAEQLAQRILGMVNQVAAKGSTRETILRRSVITTNGPLGTLDAGHTEQALRLLVAVSDHLRASIGADIDTTSPAM